MTTNEREIQPGDQVEVVRFRRVVVKGEFVSSALYPGNLVAVTCGLFTTYLRPDVWARRSLVCYLADGRALWTVKAR